MDLWDRWQHRTVTAGAVPRLRDYLCPVVIREEGRAWPIRLWRPWLRGWLPHHVVQWHAARALHRTLTARQPFADFWVVPMGYQVTVRHKTPSAATGDPFDPHETVSLHFVPHAPTGGDHARDHH